MGCKYHTFLAYTAPWPSPASAQMLMTVGWTESHDLSFLLNGKSKERSSDWIRQMSVEVMQGKGLQYSEAFLSLAPCAAPKLPLQQRFQKVVGEKVWKTTTRACLSNRCTIHCLPLHPASTATVRHQLYKSFSTINERPCQITSASFPRWQVRCGDCFQINRLN